MISSPIRTALCSYGMSGKLFHAPFIEANEKFDLYGVWERSTKNAGKKYPRIKSFGTYEAMLADTTIELVIVNTPNYTHFDYAKQALLAGKHIIVEKPFVSTTAEAKTLIQIAEEQDKIICVYQNRRWDSDFKTVKKVIDDDLLGSIVEVEIHYDRYIKELSPKAHKEEPRPGTGVLFDLGSHIIDQALYLFGLPNAVFADIDITRDKSKVHDYFELLLFYTKKRIRLKAGYLVREPVPAYVLHGVNGSFIKTRADIQENDLLADKIPGGEGWGIEPASEQGILHTEIDGELIRKHLPTEPGNYMPYFDEVYAAIRNSQKPPVNAEDGLNIMIVIEAAFESSRKKKVIDLTPQ